jgi:endonuclease YncB( thermonuclease family)
MKTLEDSTLTNTPWFSLKGLTCKCKVVSVYDADTITIVLKWDNDMYKVKCRLLGIDSAEKRTKNLEEKKVAMKGQNWLETLILDKIIWVKCGKWGKYGGRMLGTLYMTKNDLDINSSINSMIIDKGYAYKYSGKKKQSFEKWYNKKENI